MLGIFQFSGFGARLARRVDALLDSGPPLGDSMVMNLSLARFVLEAMLRALREEVPRTWLSFFLWGDLSSREVQGRNLVLVGGGDGDFDLFGLFVSRGIISRRGLGFFNAQNKYHLT